MRSNDTISLARRAHDISAAAARVGFDWEKPDDVIEKLREELDEVAGALREHDPDHLAEEIGDLFFALVNFNRKAGVDSDEAFTRGVEKFERRFRHLNQIIESRGLHIQSLTQDQLELVWDEVKKEEHHA